MKSRAFTLIELLVVVLIIGILSAIALPQYQKAVEKSRASQALIVLKSIWAAQQAFYLSNGTYAKSFEELDIDMPSWTENIKWSTYNPQIATQSNKDWSLQIDSNYLMLGRVSGPYTGAGFLIDMNNGEILCAERTDSHGFVYEKEAGSYCQKLFHATQTESMFSTLRAYKMP